ncbi:pyridoxamine 5'-phosphate oxidase family protein [Anaeromyxobacter diazotrophicus]|uniref:Pyridoxamine 5'-phosphate oxidase N-terminal domain-containing protein n=1 Tax=Anaeromyxobacter diazotrophicus TaxID=2590199 RepID=A0A7I9VMA1_9BACT|nr:pyridoxamine 5'-phosphate oxidase family protein [Anaeromyxobacter diazotrophicus]GEJ57535.1 hypothetical protein AMYX_22760 [Anaeromyxobacter diazotrophicus]
MIDEAVRAVLAQEGSAAFVTQGPGGPHLVATWQSYLRVLDDATLAFPAGGYRKTEENLRAGSPVQMILGAKEPRASGYRLSGRAELQADTPIHAELKQRFPWCRAAVVLHVTQVEKVLG